MTSGLLVIQAQLPNAPHGRFSRGPGGRIRGLNLLARQTDALHQLLVARFGFKTVEARIGI
jgi:hypothetical protein